jgi:hypothetical protein
MKKFLKYLLIFIFIIVVVFLITFGKDLFNSTFDLTTNEQCIAVCNRCVEESEASGVACLNTPHPFQMCYQYSICERQITGKCDWTQTKESKECFGEASKRF